MSLQLQSATFDDAGLGLHGARTSDGQVLSLLFDDLRADSQAADLDARPQVRRAEGFVLCKGRGWVSVQVRGSAVATGAHGFAHAMAWANGQRLRLHARGDGGPAMDAACVRVGEDGHLRLSLLLLAQRDLADPASVAVCTVDTLDLRVVEAAAPARATRRLAREAA